MLVAALDSTLMLVLVRASHVSDPVERLKDIARRRSELMSTERGGYPFPWVEFIAAGPQVGLRETIAGVRRSAFRALRDVVDEGKAVGRIQPDADSDLLAWCWPLFAWAETIGCLMGLGDFVERRPSHQMFELMLNTVTVAEG